ncbi:MAG: SDR family oxidoreductase [Chloroflexota bacterium]
MPNIVVDGLVLVTGANGFIASRLIPRLLAGSYRVRVMARKPERLAGRLWRTQVDARRGSTTDMDSLSAAMAGVHTAYYLIHSMRSGRGYTEIERESARRFAGAAEAAGMHHIIYLGGLANPGDPQLALHMRSRIETGEILRQGRVPVTEFRAGVIAGAGSISFEMIRFLTECFPILPGPRWLRNKAQPIASENVIDYLMAGLERAEARGAVYEMGGPEQMPYGEAMLRYARRRGLRRRLFTLPGIPIWWMAMIIDRLTPVPYPIATALVDGLQSDSSVMDNSALRMFPDIKLIRYEEAIGAALNELAPSRLERVWEGLDRDAANIRHEGFIVDYRRRAVDAPALAVFEQLIRMGGRHRWPYADWLWRLRGFLDRLISPQGTQRGAKESTNTVSAVGDFVDYYRVEVLEPGRLLRLHSTLRAPGEGWLEWRVEAQTAGNASLTQTAFFAPRGLAGFLYWFALGPLHQLVFRGLIGALKRRSESA